MCGIVCAYELKQSAEVLRPQLLEMSKKIRHRGPDWNGVYSDEKAILAHERLSIVDPASGKQPLLSPDGKLILAANGEIYNHQELRKQLKGQYDFKTQSDCEVILALYQEEGPGFVDKLNGIFAFSLYDAEKDEYFVARDHMGVIPLYMGWDEHGTFYVASELKALEGTCTKIELFPPGHYLHSSDGELKRWYSRDWMEYDAVKENETSIEKLREALEAAVHRQLMSDVPYGVLLSGGLDSSITSAVAKKYAEKRIESGDTDGAWWPRLHSFSVGLEGSPDLAAAQKVADHIGTVHHEIKFTIQEGLDAIKDVIYNLETYDITTIRASTPMYLMARVIKSMGVKMVLSGEGADEVFGGYLYFHKAPNAQEFHEETVRKLSKLHMYDCLRANKSLAAWGIEGRVPFLDKEFMDVAMSINPEDKMINGERMEKWVLRKAFESYLPESVAWRQKEQFSDGVGYSWIDTLKELVNEKISDEQLANAKYKFPIQTPTNKEEYYYRSIFAEHFPSDAAALSVPQEASVACSTKIALEWDEAFKNMNDPSGRAVANVHSDAYKKTDSLSQP
ncbi:MULTISPECIES: asparagine synthase B [Leeuwenhoekiella]|jgi:asparagine synthase (glutamine-hydrolysing)|uniref:asparagine synthase (glutamine-hydrolyzing) n=1 Tax=Leeuwenhoekiella blandensis (strain CECT 7118 / CCUG 51940 / KCTC 22103 / MED217) TaxID=398720 RepID=A3XJR6_LEEBM|nr:MULTISPECIES: asparagine synthase B [Leeuwenhoekiella]EAQ50208.1 asparagine synthetase B (glutamine-hydrolyzing) [Leeuwenhoekiella blandensis MED217]MAO43643.1 asparagine synthase B [Leeuwenhoekiella sp.]|tara:strand:+ start:184859 stop:186550 length:1692 start_codon:yes stop_codon:yes gene_type:complete